MFYEHSLAPAVFVQGFNKKGGSLMKPYRKELTLNTKTRRAFINITPQVEVALAESGIKEGLCLVNAMHITASVFINDNESGLHSPTRLIRTA